jgi:hypothetical protein
LITGDSLSCTLWNGKVAKGGAVTFAMSGPIPGCSLYAWAFIDVPPFDGLLDAIVDQPTDGGRDDLLLFRQNPDGTFQLPGEPVPAIFNTGGSEPVSWNANWVWNNAADLNGDGIRDMVVLTAFGAQPALADVVRK